MSQLALDDVGPLLDDLLPLGQDELDVARVGHVGVDLAGQLGSSCSVRQEGVHDRGHGMSFSGPWEPG